MIEAGANQVPDDVMLPGHREGPRGSHRSPGGPHQPAWWPRSARRSSTYPHADFDQELFDKIVAATMDEAKAAMDTDDKNVREERWNALIDHWHEQFLDDYPDMDQYLEEITYKFQKKIVKAWLLQGHRVDGRQKNEIRPLAAEVGLLPRVHGSGLFTRGQTQVLSVCHPEHPLRLPEAGHHLGGRGEALHAPLQLPRLLRGRGQGRPARRPPGDRPRRSGRAGAASP